MVRGKSDWFRAKVSRPTARVGFPVRLCVAAYLGNVG